MTDKLTIPDQFQNTFNQLMASLPEMLRNDAETQRLILIYLKFGGEKMARHGLEIKKKQFFEALQEEEDLQETDAELDAEDQEDDYELDEHDVPDADALDDEDDEDDYPLNF